MSKKQPGWKSSRPQADKEVTRSGEVAPSYTPALDPTRRQSGFAGQATIHQQAYQYLGPFPAPELLRQWEQVLPGAAERIVRNAELEGEHRREVEKAAVAQQNAALRYTARDTLLGQIFAFAICMGFLAAALYLIVQGKPTQGVFASLPPIAFIVAAFIWGRTRGQRQQTAHKGETEQGRAAGSSE